MQTVETLQQVADVGGRPEACRDAQRALDENVPGSPEAGTDKDIPRTSVCGLVPTMGRSTANDEGQLEREATAEDRERDAGHG